MRYKLQKGHASVYQCWTQHAGQGGMVDLCLDSRISGRESRWNMSDAVYKAVVFGNVPRRQRFSVWPIEIPRVACQHCHGIRSAH